jgi:transposase
MDEKNTKGGGIMKNFEKIQHFIMKKNVYCGIDVHYDHWSLCFVCDGEVVEKLRMGASYANLKGVLDRYQQARQIHCVYEAGFSGFWLYRKLTNDGYRCMVTPPSLTPRTAGKVKTDKRDAQKLAFYLVGGLLKSVYVPSQKMESDSRVIRSRAQIVKKQSRAKHQLRSFLNVHGIKKPKWIKSNWSKQYISWLEELKFEHPSDNFYLSKLLRDYHHQRKEVVEATLYLRQLSKSPDYKKNFQTLTSAPGVGLITAMTLLLEIYDFTRFSNGEQFASYLGLTPSQYSSGEHVRLGHITRQGKAAIRRVLIESAWSAIRQDPHLRDKYDRIRRKGENGKKAIVAVARSFAIRLRSALINGTDYVIGVC